MYVFLTEKGERNLRFKAIKNAERKRAALNSTSLLASVCYVVFHLRSSLCPFLCLCISMLLFLMVLFSDLVSTNCGYYQQDEQHI